MKTFASIDTSGVLDMKFNPEEIGDQHTLALALSDGYLSLRTLDCKECSWKKENSILVEDESTICLSVDWNNQMISNSNPQLAVSLSNGQMSICSLDDGSLGVKEKWNAHTLFGGEPAEVWITSFDPQDSNVVYSGGDDCIMKQWDLRLVGSYSSPVAVCRQFDAGVTSMCWNKMDPQYLTVGSYDGHIRVFDKRQIRSPVSDFDVENNAGIWRIKYKQNSNYYLHEEKRAVPHCNEMLVAAMRAGFVVLDYDESRTISSKVTYLEQGTESLAYGVDYVSMKENCSGCVASCSFYNHLMHVWKYDYSLLIVCYN